MATVYCAFSHAFTQGFLFLPSGIRVIYTAISTVYFMWNAYLGKGSLAYSDNLP